MEEYAKRLAERTNYLNKDILYLKNTQIVEYDIRSAGFTVIKEKGLLSKEEILELEKIDNKQRNILIGKKILKHPSIGESIITTLEDVRKDFVVLNELYEDDILTIKKDAMFIIKKIPTVLKVGKFEFRAKSRYTSYCYLNQKEFYYSSLTDELDIKGLSKEIKELQNDYLLKDIKNILAMSEKLSNDRLFMFLKQYRSKYLRRQLNPEVYRDMGTGKFLINGYSLNTVSKEELEDVDISQNYISYLMPLFKILI